MIQLSVCNNWAMDCNFCNRVDSCLRGGLHRPLQWRWWKDHCWKCPLHGLCPLCLGLVHVLAHFRLSQWLWGHHWVHSLLEGIHAFGQIDLHHLLDTHCHSKDHHDICKIWSWAHLFAYDHLGFVCNGHHHGGCIHHLYHGWAAFWQDSKNVVCSFERKVIIFAIQCSPLKRPSVKRPSRLNGHFCRIPNGQFTSNLPG